MNGGGTAGYEGKASEIVRAAAKVFGAVGGAWKKTVRPSKSPVTFLKRARKRSGTYKRVPLPGPAAGTGNAA